MKKLRVFNILLTIALSLYFIYLGIFHFGSSYMRLFESLGDLWVSIKFFFIRVLGLTDSVIPTVNEYSRVLEWNIILPEDFEAFKMQAGTYFSMLVSKENLTAYGMLLGDICMALLKVLAIAVPSILILTLALKKIYKCNNVKHNKDTVPLRVFKWITKTTYQPVKRLILAYISFLKRHRFIWILWLILWGIQLNLATIIVAVFAYCFYFFVSFKFDALYIQICKLFIDLQVFLSAFPWWVLLFVAFILFGRFRRKLALSKLRRLEARNCGFIKDLPIVSMTNGTMGKKKTTMITDMALSQEVMFRQKAFEILQNNDVKFPFFPWICFELELKACMRFNKIYNLATVKDFVDKKRARFSKHKNTELQLYGYDIEKYGRIYNNGLYESDLFDVLETYAKAYFIYVIECSLIVANYSIREDNAKIDIGNFPMWAMDFFPEAFRENNRHAHILDFDTLRLGRKVIEDNPNAGSFEFGVVVITEIGKERGNNLELKEIKKNTEETNQKNDLFNSWLKMCRHSATVDNFPFIKVFTDEQRPESWGADARDLCDIVNIIDSGVLKLAMPFYIIEEMLSEMVYNKFYEMYYDFRFRRGDNTLFMHLFKTVAAWLFNRNLRLYNKYGYSTLKVYKESGTQDGKRKEKKYYIMNMKTYRKRFTTDCFGDYFNELAKGTCIGLMDYIEYATEKASVEELKLQNSYFINSLYKDSGANSTS